MCGPSAIVWGDVATWATAVFTLLATVAAAVAVLYARKAYCAEVARDERERVERSERARRAQAEKVSAWVEDRPSGQDSVRALNAEQ